MLNIACGGVVGLVIAGLFALAKIAAFLASKSESINDGRCNVDAGCAAPLALLDDAA